MRRVICRRRMEEMNSCFDLGVLLLLHLYFSLFILPTYVCVCAGTSKAASLAPIQYAASNYPQVPHTSRNMINCSHHKLYTRPSNKAGSCPTWKLELFVRLRTLQNRQKANDPKLPGSSLLPRHLMTIPEMLCVSVCVPSRVCGGGSAECYQSGWHHRTCNQATTPGTMTNWCKGPAS